MPTVAFIAIVIFYAIASLANFEAARRLVKTSATMNETRAQWFADMRHALDRVQRFVSAVLDVQQHQCPTCKTVYYGKPVDILPAEIISPTAPTTQRRQ